MPDIDGRAVLSAIRRGVAFELRLYRSLFRWIIRRPDVKGPDVEAVGYAKAVTPIMWLWIFASAVEIPLFHLLIPWDTVRIVLLVVSAWGLVWMVGFLASLNVHPHLISGSALRVRNGTSIEIPIPWDAIATIGVKRRNLPSTIRTLQRRKTSSGTELLVCVSGEVNIHVVLRRALTVPTPKGSEQITELSFLADDPRALVSRVRKGLTTEVTSREPRA